MGSKAAHAVAEGREENGEYKSLFDICIINSHLINRKSIEALILSGACDNLGGHRFQLFEMIDEALRWGQKMCEDAASSQENLFGGGTAIDAIAPPTLREVVAWSSEECLHREKEIIGFYLSGDPLKKYIDDINEFANIDLANIPKSFL